jgi:hypothetical protein
MYPSVIAHSISGFWSGSNFGLCRSLSLAVVWLGSYARSTGKVDLDSKGLFTSSSPPDPPWLVRNYIGLAYVSVLAHSITGFWSGSNFGLCHSISLAVVWLGSYGRRTGKVELDFKWLFTSSSPPDPPQHVRNYITLVVCIHPSVLVHSFTLLPATVQISVDVNHYLWQRSG